MANENEVKSLATKRASDTLRDTDRTSVGVVRIISDAAGTPGDVREYQSGDEALVEAGQAQWIVAPVHSPEAGRRLDTDAEREALPAGGIEAFPPADGNPVREEKARKQGYVEAATDEGLSERLAAKRVEVARAASGSDSDAKVQAAAGGMGARAVGDLTPERLADDAGLDVDGGSDKAPAKKATPAKSAKES